MVSERLFKQFIGFCCDENTELEITTMYKTHEAHLAMLPVDLKGEKWFTARSPEV